jgi:hypothetical protein
MHVATAEQAGGQSKGRGGGASRAAVGACALRNETFFSLAALDARIGELREELNVRPMRAYGRASRRELF